MALIKCPECGKEISDLAPACIHCGYPLPPRAAEPFPPSDEELLSPDEPNRFSVVLTSQCADPENQKRTVRVLIDELGISKTEAEAYVDNAELGPVTLRDGMTQESAELLADTLQRAGAHVQVVDGGRREGAAGPVPGEEGPVQPAPAVYTSSGLGFGGTVLAVVVGVVVALVILSFF